MGWWSFLLLALALVSFMASTRQGALWTRAAIWTAGAALLSLVVAIVAVDNTHSGLFRAFQDLVANWRTPSESVVVQALQRNSSGVGRYLLPVLDLFLVIGAVLGLIGLLAFTPGERLEKITRPLATGLLGAIGGGVLALTVVGVGFGGVIEPRSYSNVVVSHDVQDGDTFWIGETSVRLFGVDAPERRQFCLAGDAQVDCGERAKTHLAELLNGALVVCQPRETSSGRVDDSFGRPLVSCEVQVGEGADFDVGDRMRADGFAVEYHRGEDIPRSISLNGMCTVHPRSWRQGDRDVGTACAGSSSGGGVAPLPDTWNW